MFAFPRSLTWSTRLQLFIFEVQLILWWIFRGWVACTIVGLGMVDIRYLLTSTVAVFVGQKNVPNEHKRLTSKRVAASIVLIALTGSVVVITGCYSVIRLNKWSMLNKVKAQLDGDFERRRQFSKKGLDYRIDYDDYDAGYANKANCLASSCSVQLRFWLPRYLLNFTTYKF